MLVDKEVRVRGIYNGLKITEVMEMIEDARFLLKMYRDEEAEKNE